ncbi:universal stress protein [Microvirga flavescens]|uniref:universal stress protein n=1 Tax=Microvirga flavescens TaxID=2249811 RepID=UPI000DD63A7E|nr:universal stress protein [Microvirga flavescens]
MIDNLKNVLIGFRQEGTPASHALRYGLSLAREAKAHASVCALSPKVVITHAFVSGVAAGLVAAENNRLRELAENAVDEARKDAVSAGVLCTGEVLQEPYAALTASFTRRARVHDLSIVDAELNSWSLERGLLEETLFNSGRPVIVVPAGVNEFKARTILIAWDGSARAVRAVNDALPFLKAAENVEILSVTGEKDLSKSVQGSDLAPHLARHGVNCSVKDLAAAGGDAGETIRNQASLIRADMIVMGAFVHSRVRQIVLGGVTETMLGASPVPLFLTY